MKEKILIAEDDSDIRAKMKFHLLPDFSIIEASDRISAIQLFDRHRPWVVILNLGLPPDENGTSEGFACLHEILIKAPKTKIIIVTGNRDREIAIKAIKMGAYDYDYYLNVSENVQILDMNKLKVIIQRAFYLSGIEQEIRNNLIASNEDVERNRLEGMIGQSPEMLKVFANIKKIATTDAAILLKGDKGTGKKLAAKIIHERSLRNKGPFVSINCTAIPEPLLDQELFGYDKVSLTDATAQKNGMIEMANGGTLFLDEIENLPVHLQVKLLRLLQDRKIQKVGSREEIDIDTRIIAATNIDLQKAIKEGKFREDLYYNISVITIELPPLRDRDDDILLLAHSFLNKFNYAHKKNIKGFSQTAIRALESYEWPGNVRELENKIQRAVIMSDDQVINPQELLLEMPEMNQLKKDNTPLTLKDIRQKLQKVEFEIIQKALIRNAWNISKTAVELGISRPTLHDMINKYGLKSIG